ncbi:polysaccharide biosynthesis protein [Pseudanabaenaceae cyanobacterium LEGE 13415]|nr:polysaccharide biosynthesis protein [Pseudanabaenaceae cyanobacterium LEGE 13415]
MLLQQLMRLKNRHFFLIDAAIFAIAPKLALIIRLDGHIRLQPFLPGLIWATILFLMIKLSLLYFSGFYRRCWRYASIDELQQIAMVFSATIVLETLLFSIPHPTLPNTTIFDLPRSLPLLDGMISFALVGIVRFSVRTAERVYQRKQRSYRNTRILIVGAGGAGVSLVQEMNRTPSLGLHPVAFIDDDPTKLNLKIHGLPVVGDRASIPEMVRKCKIHRVIIAMPTASGETIRDIAEICQQTGVQTSTLPSIHEILNGRVSLSNVRDVQIEDLLRRAPIEMDVQQVSDFISGKRVLITGAGGSIGSELCRQILKFQPLEMILVGHGENSVFNIQQELEKTLSSFVASEQMCVPRLVSFIADIRFIDRLEHAFEYYHPQIVFHAAAHKHVPMMELNACEAITNNVQGTKNLLNLALKYDVEHFVMISTDKAINPTNIMGASKRVAEMLVLQAARESKKPYVVVRFGNVLGSRGSVVPTFKRQIAQGGPVTITHPEICRYFMTIPEAVQLVLQASVIGKGGEVFMLDMGQPVKIVDLAKELIHLSGYRLGENIEIVFTGLRPGEKLFEELFIPGEQYESTQHEKLFVVKNASGFVPETLDFVVSALYRSAARNDMNAIVFLLKQIVPGYQPSLSPVHSTIEPSKVVS